MILAVLLTGLLAISPGAEARPIEVYVSTKGDDGGVGTLRSPFASISRARDEIRKVRSREGGQRRAVIVLRSGTYYLPEPLVLTHQDSKLTVRAHKQEQATVSGGRRIEGLKEVEVGGRKVWAARIDDVASGKRYFRALYKGQRMLPRPRLPKSGYYRIANPPPDNTPLNVTSNEFQFNDGEMSGKWSNISDVEAVVLHFWEQSRMPLVRIDNKTRTAYFSKKSGFRLTDDFTPAGARYYIENVFEALSEPGEWYLDRLTGMLYYMPMPGDELATTHLFAPSNERIVEIKGDAGAGRYAEGIRLEGIAFCHTDWSMPPDRSGYEQASWGVPGEICISDARDCAIQGCTISGVGGYGVQIAAGSSDTLISRNNIRDLGAGAVKIERGSKRTIVTDNEICDGGKVFHSAVGVLIMDSGYNHVAHNHVRDFDYSGISAGWCWSYDRNNAKANVIEYNHIHDIGRGVLSDLAGIYTLGPQPGTVIRNNLIYNCSSNTYGGWGIYLDASSSNIVVENNIVYRNKSGGFFQPSGKENTVRNNVFALNTEAQIAREKAEPHISLRFQRNIVYWTEGDLLAQNWQDDGFEFDSNLYWRTDGGSILFGKETFEQWQARGQDVNSLIAHPMFRAPAKGDFTTLPGSPVARIGWKPIDVTNVGPRR